MNQAPATSADRFLAPAEREIWRILADVPDPEIPVLSVVELGIVRHVRVADDRRVTVGVSPTYTGCPATEVIARSIQTRLEAEGYEDPKVESVLSPPWSSDWVTESGRAKLKEYGIAPPAQSVSNPKHLFREPKVACPRCSSMQTRKVSEFASTPCKALYRCESCLEPFEYFKCI
ncbi:1,2-phenylacetyl-CoA epoxidase subunit PaaD [Peristeroidobacter soli]|jgi:ring-1,2-phenylacetyl-CoA epoxidase subunit PaaD|uniref:1,2-phenylacetyl-CoA epoxidase subunit PaaD n=1 Tax=Peristeroidobacter soli TaxID=2497877 RepID=UPI00101C2A2E|nr:1,2-phenylacetyl-CoA epoxidase subunit PaaD [Peristeroidobacter soli]